MSTADYKFSDATAIASSVSDIASVLAHDFNNILTGILGNLELLERRASKQGLTEFDIYLANSRSAASRGVALTQRLITIAGLQILEPTTLHTPSFIASLEAPLTAILGEQLQLQIDCPATTHNLYCDAFKLEGSLADIAKYASSTAQISTPVVLMAANLTIKKTSNPAHEIPPGQYVAISLQYKCQKPTHDSKADLELATLQGFAKQSGGQAFLDAHQPGRITISLILPASPSK
ncbi:MAG: histidine kinase dimerization/phospho-acceptor domain-containing protein [Acidocella sp.]|nr:histidine kinase dimerization/phospho-acceptor domain-containing protein [Acidocella sp.]